MKYGVFLFATDKAMNFADLAGAAEERGFESIWAPEHVHIPVERETPYPLSEDGELPEMYTRLHDPFIVLAAAAAVTSTIRLGTSICLVTEREPIALAKTVTSLDYISDGRVEFGIGAGWLREEMEPFGVRFETRWKVTQQRVEALKAMWTQDEPSYQSEFVDIPRTFVYPKPKQDPHPPVLIGATSRFARQRVVDWAEGWLPNVSRPDYLERGIADLRERADAAGRDPESIPVTVLGGLTDALSEYERIGVDRVIFMLPSEQESVVMPELDRLAALI